MSRIRITGGAWRSRLVKVAASKGLRPTPDRVRVTLFNWLGQDLSGLSCLDLFAGSGVLGFEAASRGAARVTLIEQDQSVFETLRQNAQALAPLVGEHLELIRMDAVKFAATSTRRYDLIFIDPPYRQDWIERVAPSLPSLANPGARLYIEAEHAVDSLGAWRSVRQGRAGQVFYQLLEQA